MTELLEQTHAPDARIRNPDRTVALDTRSGERAARADLRRQIAALERQLSGLLASAYPRRGIDLNVGAAGGPRVLGIADLERVRDSLAIRIGDARTELGRRTTEEERNRERIEAMISDPDRHRWVRISNEDIGEVECRHWHSRPRWGILGALLGWWRVKLSSGCPLAGSPFGAPLGRSASVSPGSGNS